MFWYKRKKNGQRRRKCKECGREFRLAKSYTKKLRKAAEQWILDRSTFQRIQDKSGYSKMGKWKQVQQYAKHIPHPLEHLEKHISQATSILLLDATFTRVSGKEIAIMIAYDTGIGVIDFWVDETENKTAYSYILRRLKDRKYEPICVVSDGHFSIIPLVREERIPHQRCVTHLLRELRRSLAKKENGELEGKNLVIYRRIQWLFRTKKIEDIPKRLTVIREASGNLFKKKGGTLRWFWQILPDAILHLSYEENIPCTTNLLENLNGQIKQRIKTTRGMKSEKSLHNLLKVLFYFRKYK